MQHAPPLLQETARRHLVGEGMGERVCQLGKQPGLIQKLGGLQVGETTVQLGLGHLGNGLQQGQGHLRADHGGGLEEPLLLGR